MNGSPRKVRLAPTPSGYLHEGNLANFLLNERLAGPAGEVLLRIDDLDRGRFRREYLEDIFTQLMALDIQVTQGPTDAQNFEQRWSQRHRMALYEDALEQLRHHDLVFACPCSRKELALGKHRYGCLTGAVSKQQTGVAWRVRTAGLPPITLPDQVIPTGFTVDVHQEIPEFVVRTKTGRPSYQLACTVDDFHFNITHIGRGQDLLPSTAAQVLLSDMLAYPTLVDRISLVHHTLISSEDGEKLSKSAGAQSSPLQLSAARLVSLNSIVDQWLQSK